MEKKVRVGVGVVILRDGKVLVGQRKGSHGAGAWSVPGGHLEFGESTEACAIREVLEETGIQLDPANVREIVFSASNVFPEIDTHYITLWAVAHLEPGQEAQNLEPEKCNGWEWHDWETIPTPLFPPIEQFIDCLRPQSHSLGERT